MPPTSDPLALLGDLVERARRAGADEADAILFDGASLQHAQRLGKLEKLERAEGFDLGLRVIIGKRQAIVSSNDRDADHSRDLIGRAIEMAKTVPEDPFCGLADPTDLARKFPALDLEDPVEPSPAILAERAGAAEDAANAIKGVTNSEGAQASWSRSVMALVASNGFAGRYGGTNHSIVVSVLAGEGTAMERDDDWTSAAHAADLKSAAEIGRSAGERAVRRLKARKMPTAKVPVIYDPRVAGSLLRHFAGAINGVGIARGTSFLKDKLGQPVFPANIDIIDDPHLPRGHRSTPFDGEGVANRKRILVEKGVLQTWLMDSAAARQLNLATTGNAHRGSSGPPGPGPFNLYIAPGAPSRRALMSDIASGFYVTELMGMGVNGVTGDYSRGAAGFWIENGELAFPVSEVTVAGNLKDMFRNLAAADDLEFRTGIDAPTLRLEGMMVAGS
ncbi:MAG TPA: metallopeptidase TldD-related protein [Stellaceae bacterium]|nr:metallopeptidase TldD-related protein [Stellaceae bacterium]